MSTQFLKFQFLRRHFYFWARRRALRFGAAFSHWASLQYNPFLLRELRRSVRHKSGPFFVLWPPVLIGLSLILIAQFGERLIENLSQFARQQEFPPQLVKMALGQNVIGLMALAASGLCGYATLIYSLRAARVLLREHNSGTFNQLLLWPLQETRVALLASAPAAFSAITLWFLLLPLWLLTLATNQWSLREFFGIPLLFLLFAVRPPEWAPLYETYISSQSASGKVAEEPEEKPDAEPDAETAEEDTTEKLDSGDSAQKTSEEFEEAEEEEVDEEPLFAADPRHVPLFKFDPAGTINLFLVWQGAMFWARVAGFRTPPAIFNYLLPQWREFLPVEVWHLLPSILLSWPLLLVQFLVTPLPFFNFALPPGLWLVPRALLARYAAFSIFRLSYLGSHSLQFRRWGRYWRVAKKTQAYLFWFFASGFLWPWFINKGAFAALLPGAPINAAWARVGLWTVLLIITTWTVSARLHSVLDTPFKKLTAIRRQKYTIARCRKAWRNMGRFFCIPVALYFVPCWLAGMTGMDAEWRSRLLTTVSVMLAYLLADFCSLALKNVLSEGPRTLWNWLRFLWFWGLLWEAVFRVGWAHYAATPFALKDAPHLALSPLVSLLTLLNYDVTISLQGALCQAGIAVFLGLSAAYLILKRQSIVMSKPLPLTAAESTKRPSLLWRSFTNLWRILWFVPSLVIQVLFWPVKIFFKAVYQQLKGARNAVQPFLDYQVNELWRWIDSFDNPILRRDLRTKREESLSSFWLSAVAMQLFVLLILLGLSLIKPLSLLLYGGNTSYNRQAALEMLNLPIWGNVVFGVAIVFGLLANLAALFSLTKAFDSERANGGIVFLFLTPLTEGEILGGHIGVALVSGVWLHSALYPVILLACLLEIAAGQLSFLPLLLLLVLLLHGLLVLSAITSVWSAVRAKNVSEGGPWAFFSGLMPQAILIIGLMFILSTAPLLWSYIATFLGIVFCAAGIFVFWLDALRGLHRERFGDVSLRGTITN